MMADDCNVVELDGVEYVRKAVHDRAVAKIASLETVLTSIKRQASEQLAEPSSRRQRTTEPASAGSGDGSSDRAAGSSWSLHKISGPGFRSDGIPTQLLQLYRIDTGNSSTTDSTAPSGNPADAAAGSSSSTQYYFRPRDVLQMIAQHEVWQPSMLRKLEDKVDNLVNKQQIGSIQDKVRVQEMMKRCKNTLNKSRDDLKGFRQYAVRLVSFDSMIELYLALLRDAKTPRPTRAATRSRAAAADIFGNEEESESGDDGNRAAAAAAAAEGEAGAVSDDEADSSAADEGFLRADVVRAFSWMADPDAAWLRPDSWQAPMA